MANEQTAFQQFVEAAPYKHEFDIVFDSSDKSREDVVLFKIIGAISGVRKHNYPGFTRDMPPIYDEHYVSKAHQIFSKADDEESTTKILEFVAKRGQFRYSIRHIKDNVIRVFFGVHDQAVLNDFVKNLELIQLEETAWTHRPRDDVEDQWDFSRDILSNPFHRWRASALFD